MNVLIREATDADLPALAAVYAVDVETGTGTFETTAPSADEMGRRLAAVRALGLPWLVTEQDGRVVAYGYLGPFRTRPAYRYTVEDSIYVLPQAQGQGLGGRLLDALIAHCRATGLRQILAVIGDSTNTGSIALHRSRGFTDTGVLTKVGHKFDRWIDVVMMQLDVADGDAPTGQGMPL